MEVSTENVLPGLEREVVDRAVYERSVRLFRDARIQLPTFAQLADPDTVPAAVRVALEQVDPDAPDPLNLFRVHWHNDRSRRGIVAVPEHVVLPERLTGVAAPIIVAFGDRFPLIHTHKVLAAYGCLAPRIVTGTFDPTRHRAIWPSTGNYCRGGVAISRILGCRGVAVLPEGMSAERFRWLESWVRSSEDVIRTPGTESNVKEIYDRCAVLARDPANVVLNQFSEFGNHLAHRVCTGHALERVFAAEREARPSMRLAAFVSATGSAGTIGAGDYLKERLGARIVAAEALECPTLLMNGYGSHNIQGIGDKHVPLIHNVMNTDVVVAVSDRATDELNLVFNHPAGRRFLTRRHQVPAPMVEALSSFGLSSICNVIAAVKTAKLLGFGPDDAILTVATDGAEMYASEAAKLLERRYPQGYDETSAGEAYGEYLLASSTDHSLLLSPLDRHRIFNLGYFTWVEQQGVALEQFEARRCQQFWSRLMEMVPLWDGMIDAFNRRTGMAAEP